eukprot:2012879-Prymnesium_polylepis.1
MRTGHARPRWAIACSSATVHAHGWRGLRNAFCACVDARAAPKAAPRQTAYRGVRESGPRSPVRLRVVQSSRRTRAHSL